MWDGRTCSTGKPYPVKLVAVCREIGDILLTLNRVAGVTLLLVEQQLRFARRVASDFRLLEKGRCVAGGPVDELTDALIRAHLSV